MTSRLNWQTTNNFTTQLTNQINNQSIIPSTEVIQLTLTLKMTTAQVIETSVTVNNNSPIQDYIHPEDQTQPTFEFIGVAKIWINLLFNCFSQIDTIISYDLFNLIVLYKRDVVKITEASTWSKIKIRT